MTAYIIGFHLGTVYSPRVFLSCERSRAFSTCVSCKSLLALLCLSVRLSTCFTSMDFSSACFSCWYLSANATCQYTTASTCISSRGHDNMGIIFSCIGNSQWCLYNTQSKSDRLFNTQSRVLQADWMILELVNINMPFDIDMANYEH